MRKPGFFILGAPKCGTTALAYYLGRHPRIFLPQYKEPHFFNTDVLPRHFECLDSYLELFSPATAEHLAVGEATTAYLYSRNAVPNILSFNSEAVVVVMVRNPVDMAQALHAEEVYQCREPITDFEIAWRLQDSSYSGKRWQSGSRRVEDVFKYGSRCKTGEQVERLFARVPANRVHVIVFDDFVNDTARVYTEVLDFLGVPNDGRSSFPPLNKNKKPQFPLINSVIFRACQMKRFLRINQGLGIAELTKSMNSKVELRATLRADLREELTAYFRDDVLKLGYYLKRDFDAWR